MFTKNIFNQKSDAIVDLINKINEADYKVKMEALKGGQVKLDKNKNNKLDADDFKILRGEKKKVEEASPFDWKKPREPEAKGGSGVKAGRAYGGAAQKSKPEQNDADDKKKKVDEEIDPNDATTDTLAGRVKGKSKNPFLQSKVRLDVPGNVKEEIEQVDEALRTVSTHGKGEGEHHAVVKRDAEWNEYQVHFYKGGKHMGEGPVSHHDDKADAQSTAETEVKRMNAKKNEEFSLEDVDPALVEEFMQTEEFEQLDELSKKTLGDYVKKASHDVAHKGAMTRQHANDSKAAKDDQRYNDAKKSDDKANKTFAKSWKRRQGMAKAVDRLAKEEVEQTDEAATMQPKGPARVDVPAYKRVNMKPLSLKDVVTRSTEKKNKLPNAVKEESEQIGELSTPTLSSYIKKRGAQLGGGSTDRPKIKGMNAALRKVKQNSAKKTNEEVENIDERELSSGETAEKERIVKGMKKGLAGFKSRYGSRAKEVMYATATKQAKE